MTEEPPNYPPPNYPPPSYPPPSYSPPTPGGYDYPASSYPPPSYPPPSYPPPAPGGYGGYGFPPAYPPPASSTTNTMAIASFIACIAGFFTCGIGTILGLIFGVLALNQIKRTGEGGRGLAIAGLIVSGISVALFVLVLIIASIPHRDRHRYDTYDSQHAVQIVAATQQTISVHGFQ